MMHDRWMRTRLQAHLDGRLSPRKRAALTRHLTQCAACAETLKRLTAEESRLRAARPEPQGLSPEASRAVLQRALAALDAPPARSEPGVPVPAFLAACLVLLSLLYLGWNRWRALNMPHLPANTVVRAPKTHSNPQKVVLQPDVIRKPPKNLPRRNEPQWVRHSLRRAQIVRHVPTSHELPHQTVPQVAIRDPKVSRDNVQTIAATANQSADKGHGFAYVRAYYPDAQGHTTWKECTVTEQGNGKERARYVVSSPDSETKLVLAVTQRGATLP
jgi:hypothetical protein